jgi:flagellar hook-associated protein 3 FlgL
MSIRITQGTMFSRAVADVQRGLQRTSLLQQQIATGRRVLRPSDDPVAMLQITPLRGDIARLEQLRDNTFLARETLDTTASSLEDASEVMQRARELTMQASNGTLSQSDRASIAAELDQLLGQMLGVANSKRGDRYLFGGTADDGPPFELVQHNGRSTVAYRGNRETLGIDVAPGVKTNLNIPGDTVFQARDRGATTLTPLPDTTATGAQPVLGGSNAIGFQRLDVTWGGLTADRPPTVTAGNGATTALGPLSYAFDTVAGTLSVGGGAPVPIPVSNGTFTTADGRTISLTVTGAPPTTSGSFTSVARLSTDGGESVVVVDDFTQPTATVVSALDGLTLYVDPRGITHTGAEEVRHEGTFDAFTTLISLRDLLRNDNGLPDADVQSRLSGMLSEIDGALDAVLDGTREVGFRSASMEALRNRVEDLSSSRQDTLSRLEDTDITEAILRLQQQDISYQAALQISARVVQTNLTGFLR